MPTVANAPSGENTSPAGTEKFPISGSQFILLSTIAHYALTLAAVYEGDIVTSDGEIVWT